MVAKTLLAVGIGAFSDQEFSCGVDADTGLTMIMDNADRSTRTTIKAKALLILSDSMFVWGALKGFLSMFLN